MRVLIIANGEIKDIEFLRRQIQSHDYVICADGAAKYLKHLEILPDILMGDFDSIVGCDMEWMIEKGVKLEAYPPRKDFTDTELALEYGMDLKPHSITIIGGIGSRWDHSIGNVMLLYKLLDKGIRGYILNETNCVTITSDLLEVYSVNGRVISIIPITPYAMGVTLEGMEYPLKDYDIKMGATIGISNVLKAERGTISVREGMLLVFQSSEEA